MPNYSVQAERQMAESNGYNDMQRQAWDDFVTRQRQQQLAQGEAGLANDGRDFAERQRQFNVTNDNSRYGIDQSNQLARDLMGQRTNAFQSMLSQGNGYQYQPMGQYGQPQQNPRIPGVGARQGNNSGMQLPPWMNQPQGQDGQMNNALMRMLLGQMGG